MSKIRRLYDFCNAKYQGETSNSQPEGFGMLLDDNFTLLLSQWKVGKIVSPSIAIFEDSTMVYGTFQKQEKGIVVYCNFQFMVYEFEDRIAADYFQAGYLLKLERRQKERNLNNENNEEFKIVEERVYNNLEEKSKILQEILNTNVPDHYMSFQTFIKQSFKKTQLQIPNPSKMIQKSSTPKRNLFIHPRTIYNISFKKASIYLKMLEKDQRVLQIGYTSNTGNSEPQTNRCYFYNNQNYKKWQVKQKIQNELECFEYEDFDAIAHKQSPQIDKSNHRGKNMSQTMQKNPSHGNIAQNQKLKINLKKKMGNYFKSSLSFVNKYINLKKIYLLHKYNLTLRQFLQKVNSGKYGQKKIQMGNDEEQTTNKIGKDKSTPAKEVSTEDLKQQLNRVKRIGSRSPMTSKSPSRIIRDNIGQNRFPQSSPRNSPVRQDYSRRYTHDYNNQRSASASRRFIPQSYDRSNQREIYKESRISTQYENVNKRHLQNERLRKARQDRDLLEGQQEERQRSAKQKEKQKQRERERERQTERSRLRRNENRSKQIMDQRKPQIQTRQLIFKESNRGAPHSKDISSRKYPAKKENQNQTKRQSRRKGDKQDISGFIYTRYEEPKAKNKDTRYSYLEDSNREHYAPGMTEQLGDLIGTYKNIDSQMKKQTPKNKKKNLLDNSPFRFTYLRDAQTPRYIKVTQTFKPKNERG